MSDWLDDLERPPRSEEAKEAIGAIETMGEEASRHLAKLILEWDERLENPRFKQNVNHALIILAEDEKLDPAIPILLDAARRHASDVPTRRAPFDFALGQIGFAHAPTDSHVSELLELASRENMEHGVGVIGRTVGALLPEEETATPYETVEEALNHRLMRVRVSAALALLTAPKESGFSPEAQTILIEALKPENHPIPIQVLISLGQSEKPLTFLAPAIYELFQSDHEDTRRLAVKRFLQVAADPLPKIIKACKSSSLPERESGARALFAYVARHVGSQPLQESRPLFEELKPVYAELLNSDNEAVLMPTLQGLGLFGANAKALLPEVKDIQNFGPKISRERKDVINELQSPEN